MKKYLFLSIPIFCDLFCLPYFGSRYPEYGIRIGIGITLIIMLLSVFLLKEWEKEEK